MCKKCVAEGRQFRKYPTDPDPERDALWKPVAWKVGSNHGNLEWLARLPVARLSYEHRQSPHEGEFMWISDYAPPHFMEEIDGQRYLYGGGYGNGLAHWLEVPWAELEVSIRAAGEDPFTLPFSEILVSGLHWKESRDLAFAWIHALPDEVFASEDVLATLSYLRMFGDERARAILNRHPEATHWVPFLVVGPSGNIQMTHPSKWRRKVRELVFDYACSLERIFDARVGLDPFMKPGFYIDSPVAAQTLHQWTESANIELRFPEFDALQIDPRPALWQRLLQEKLNEMRGSNVCMSFVYSEELEARTGHMIPDRGYGLVRATLDAFGRDPEFEVIQHTFNRYHGEVPSDRYFRIAARKLPPGIDIG